MYIASDFNVSCVTTNSKCYVFFFYSQTFIWKMVLPIRRPTGWAILFKNNGKQEFVKMLSSFYRSTHNYYYFLFENCCRLASHSSRSLNCRIITLYIINAFISVTFYKQDTFNVILYKFMYYVYTILIYHSII